MTGSNDHVRKSLRRQKSIFIQILGDDGEVVRDGVADDGFDGMGESDESLQVMLAPSPDEVVFDDCSGDETWNRFPEMFFISVVRQLVCFLRPVHP